MTEDPALAMYAANAATRKAGDPNDVDTPPSIMTNYYNAKDPNRPLPSAPPIEMLIKDGKMEGGVGDGVDVGGGGMGLAGGGGERAFDASSSSLPPPPPC